MTGTLDADDRAFVVRHVLDHLRKNHCEPTAEHVDQSWNELCDPSYQMPTLSRLYDRSTDEAFKRIVAELRSEMRHSREYGSNSAATCIFCGLNLTVFNPWCWG